MSGKRVASPKGKSKEEPLFEDDFFVPFNGSMFNAIRERELTPKEFCVLSMLLRQVEFETGIWTGSAYWISTGWGNQVPLRTIQECLKQLGEKGQIKSFHRRGQRNDYMVAIHGYRVRFGDYKGYWLDAQATTDPHRPVYHPGCESTAKKQRNDPAVTTSSVPVNSAPAENPIARNTPDCQTSPEVEEEQTASESPATTENDSKFVKHDVDVDGGASRLNGLNSQGENASCLGSGQSADRRRFLGRLRAAWSRHEDIRFFKFSKKQLSEAFNSATTIGEDLFVAAWEFWVSTASLYVGTRETAEPLWWPLQTFMDSGALAEIVDKIRPFMAAAKDQLTIDGGFEALEYLVKEAHEQSTLVSQEDFAALAAFIHEHGTLDLTFQLKAQSISALIEGARQSRAERLNRATARANGGLAPNRGRA